MSHPAFIRLLEKNIDGVAADSLDDSTVLASLPQWDSLAVLTVIALISEQSGKTVSGRRIGECVTVGELATLAQSV